MAKQLKINYASAYLKYQLTKGLWLIHKRSSYGQLSTVFDFIDNKIEVTDNMEEPEMTRPYTIKIINNTSPGQNRNVAVIPIMGSLMKKDYCGAPGMQTIASRIKRAENDDSISGILFHVDSPGGTVDGTQELSNTIENCSKPTLGFADGLAASGAYWAISSTDLVVAKDTTTEIGSIGVVLSFMDNRKALEEKGYVVHEIVADGSPEKWKEMLDAQKGDYSTLREWTLNPILDVFQESVINNMPGVNTKALKGRVYLAKQAKKLKLINKIGNFDFALKELNKLINKNIMENDNKVVEMTITEDEKGLFDRFLSYVKPEIKDISDETKKEYENRIQELEKENGELKNNIEAYGIEKDKIEKDAEVAKAKEAKALEDIEKAKLESETRESEISELKTELTKKVAVSSEVVNEDDKLEIGKLSKEDEEWNETLKGLKNKM